MKEKIQAFMAKRQAKGKRSYEIDMCNGPLLGKILRFAVPLMLSGVLQLFFNAADIVVVGRFTGHTALAAVGSTGALINLLINVFVGLSIGTNVLVARYYGAQDAKQLSETVPYLCADKPCERCYIDCRGRCVCWSRADPMGPRRTFWVRRRFTCAYTLWACRR